MESHDPYDLERFVLAQNARHINGTLYTEACAELSRGRKENHWMWFIFPQIRGLGQSFMSEKYAISGRHEAVAYIGHPVLGPRLRNCTQIVNSLQERSVSGIFGYPDDLKFHSCMTLFSNITDQNEEFVYALTKFFGEQRDKKTLERL